MKLSKSIQRIPGLWGLGIFLLTFLPAVLGLSLSAAQAQPQLRVAPDPLDFNSVKVTNSRDLSLSITNISGHTITIDFLQPLGTDAADFSVITPTAFPISLPAAASLNVILRFRPSATGIKAAQLLIETSDGNLSSSLAGVATAPQANIRILPSLVDFGKIAPGNAPIRNVSVINDGPDSARFDNYALQNDNGAVFFEVNYDLSQPLWLHKGETLVLPIRFLSELPSAIRSGRIVLSGQFLGPNTIELKGETVQANLTFDVPSIDLGDVYVGEIRDTFLIINSTGEATLTISEVLDLSNGFSLLTKLPLPYDVPTGTSQRIDIRFNPSVPGPAFNQVGVIAKGLAVGGNFRTVNITANVLPNPVWLSKAGTLIYQCAIDTLKRIEYTFACRGKGNVNVSKITVDDPRFTLETPVPISVSPGDNVKILFSFRPNGSAAGRAVVSLLSGTALIATDTIILDPRATIDAFTVRATPNLLTNSHDIEILAPKDMNAYRLTEFLLHVSTSAVDRSTIDASSFVLTPVLGGAKLDVLPVSDGYNLRISDAPQLIDASFGTSPILTFATRDFLSDSVTATLRLTAASAEAAECLTFTDNREKLDLSASCGDDVLRAFLRKGNLFSVVSVTPNPAKQFANLTLDSRGASSARIRLISPVGETQYMTTAALPKGQSVMTIPTGQLTSGAYTLWIRAENGEEIRLPLLVIH